MLRIRYFALLGMVALMGCGVKMDAPKPASVREIKSRTMLRIERFEKALNENRLHPQDIKNLGASLVWLRGHMRATNVGTEEQFKALDEALYLLSGTDQGGAMAPPADWRPGDDNAPPPPPPIIEPGPLREIIPQIKRIVETVPDSDLRPNIPSKEATS